MDRGEVLLRGDPDPAQRVDDLLEPGEVDHRHVVDADPGELLYGLHHQRHAAPRVRRVDLRVPAAVVAVPDRGHGDPGVPGDRDELRAGPVLRQVGQDDRVGTGAPVLSGSRVSLPRIRMFIAPLVTACGRASSGTSGEGVDPLDVRLHGAQVEPTGHHAAHPEQRDHQQAHQDDPPPAATGFPAVPAPGARGWSVVGSGSTDCGVGMAAMLLIRPFARVPSSGW